MEVDLERAAKDSGIPLAHLSTSADLGNRCGLGFEVGGIRRAWVFAPKYYDDAIKDIAKAWQETMALSPEERAEMSYKPAVEAEGAKFERSAV